MGHGHRTVACCVMSQCHCSGEFQGTAIKFSRWLSGASRMVVAGENAEVTWFFSHGVQERILEGSKRLTCSESLFSEGESRKEKEKKRAL